MDSARMVCWFKCPNCGGDARDFWGIWRSAAEITPGRFEAVEIGGQKESRAIAGPALMAIQGRALYPIVIVLTRARHDERWVSLSGDS